MRVVIAVSLLAMSAGALVAQSAPEPVRRVGVTWYRVLHLDFVPSQATGALQILDERIIPAAEQADIPPALVVQHVTGDWDVSLYFPMEGPDDLGWVNAPRDIAFRRSLADREGGMEAAMRILADFQARVARQSQEVVTMRVAR